MLFCDWLVWLYGTPGRMLLCDWLAWVRPEWPPQCRHDSAIGRDIFATVFLLDGIPAGRMLLCDWLAWARLDWPPLYRHDSAGGGAASSSHMQTPCHTGCTLAASPPPRSKKSGFAKGQGWAAMHRIAKSYVWDNALKAKKRLTLKKQLTLKILHFFGVKTNLKAKCRPGTIAKD